MTVTETFALIMCFLLVGLLFVLLYYSRKIVKELENSIAFRDQTQLYSTQCIARQHDALVRIVQMPASEKAATEMRKIAAHAIEEEKNRLVKSYK